MQSNLPNLATANRPLPPMREDMMRLNRGERVKVSDAPIQTAELIRFPAFTDQEELLELLRAQHPEYTARATEWQACGDIGLDRLPDTLKSRYLIKGTAEDPKLFDQRCSLSQLIPEAPSILEQFLGSIFKDPARREGFEDNEKLNQFIRAADCDERDMADVMKDVLRYALVFGSCDAFFTHPRGKETEIPYLALYSPENRLDWQSDMDGEYSWVKFHESYYYKPDWGTPGTIYDEYKIITSPKDDGGYIYCYRVHKEEDKIVIEQYDSDSDTWIISDSQATPFKHSFHRCPVRTFYWNYLQPGIGQSWIAQLVKSEIKTFRLESDLTNDVFVHAHPVLLAKLHPDKDGKNPLRTINLGGDAAHHLNPGNKEQNPEDLAYLALDSAPLEIQTNLVQAQREITRRLSNYAIHSEQDKPANPESGVAMSIRQDLLSKHLGTASRSLEDYERKVLEMVIYEFDADAIEKTDDEIKDEMSKIQIQYPARFDIRSLEQLEQEMDDATKVGSETLIKEVKKSMAAKILGSAADPELLDKIVKEIEAGAEDGEEGTEDGEDALTKGAEKEAGEHPSFTPEQAKQIAADHLKEDPNYYSEDDTKDE